MKYHHIGIPAKKPQTGEIYLESYDIYCTEHDNNPYGIQYMRYGKKCRLPKIVKEVSHIAFEVEDIEEAIRGKEVIIKPNSPVDGLLVAFIVENGAPIEFLQFTKEEKKNEEKFKYD
ncbi:hypothetical protein P0136_11955 [Lentisphaerota bacterium ZTH]|nr:hypothetical protein JYG24_10535 [Lentisphaerota bacterium]WET06071.1 hypothetical protein P0136_11955 [Lentisphaerota bacterium ZTH]